MDDFKQKKSRSDFFKIELILLCFISLNFSIITTAQLNGQAFDTDKTIKLWLPFRPCLQKEDDNILSVTPASDNKEEYFSVLKGGKVAKTRLTTNTTLWMSELGGEIVTDLIFDDGKIFFITKKNDTDFQKENNLGRQASNYILWSLNSETGLTERQLPLTSEKALFLESYRHKLFLINKDGNITSLTNDLQRITTIDLAHKVISAAAFFENRIYIGTEDNLILVISADNLEVVSKIPTLQSPASVLEVTKDKLFWGEKKGYVNFFDTKNNKLVWSVRYGGEISSLDVASDGILVSSLDNFVYKISLQNGKRIWKRRLTGRVFAKPLILNNFALFVTVVDNNAVILDLKDGKVVNQLSLDENSPILSKPAVLHKLLMFVTNRGLFGFAEATADCPLN